MDLMAEVCKSSLLYLTLSWRRPLSYRNQSIDLQSKSMDWFLYDRGLRHERVKFWEWISLSVFIDIDRWWEVIREDIRWIDYF